MTDSHSVEDVIGFLNHAGERGLIPAATAQALAVATRNVFSVLGEEERAALPLDDLDGVIRRFTNKRARDFNPASLKEYGRRVRRAVEMYLRWREDPANFTVKTRTTTPARKRATAAAPGQTEPVVDQHVFCDHAVLNPHEGSGYQTAFPVRPGQVVQLRNVPHDLTASEAERLAQFIRLLAPV